MVTWEDKHNNEEYPLSCVFSMSLAHPLPTHWDTVGGRKILDSVQALFNNNQNADMLSILFDNTTNEKQHNEGCCEKS